MSTTADSIQAQNGPTSAGEDSIVDASNNNDQTILDDPTIPVSSVGGFVKTLSSDLDDAESLLLLQQVQAIEPLFKNFDSSELEMLAQVLSVLHFSEGDKIISKGEVSTFCGIILSGTFTAIVSETLKVPLGTGKMVGEMSYFEQPSIRNSDVIAATDAVLAVVTFQELDALQLSAPRLQNKFIKALGQASLAKLRQTGGPSTGTQIGSPTLSAAPASATTTKDSTTATSAASDKPGHNKRVSSIPARPNYLEGAKIETLYKGRLQRQKQSAKAILENEKQSRLLAERQQYRSAAAQRDLQSKNATLMKELEALRLECDSVKYTQETESRMTQRTILGLQEEQARWKIKYNQEVLARQNTEDQLSEVLETVQKRHMKAVAMLRANVPGVVLDEEEERVLARFAPSSSNKNGEADETGTSTHTKSILLSDEPFILPQTKQRAKLLIKKKFQTLTKLAVTQYQHAEATKEKSNLSKINTDLSERLAAAEKKLETMDALRESSFQASLSHELNRKRMLARLDLANNKIKDLREELIQIKLLLRTVVVTRTIRDVKTKRNLISLKSKLDDFFQSTIEKTWNLIPDSFGNYLVTIDEMELSSTLGGEMRGEIHTIPQTGSGVARFSVSSVSTTTAMAASPTTPNASNAAATPAVANSKPTGPSTSASASTITFPAPTQANLGLSGAVRTPLETLALLRERRKTALRTLIHQKSKLPHSEFLGLIDGSIENFIRLVTQLLNSLGFYYDLSKSLTSRVSELTARSASQTLLSNDLLQRYVHLRNTSELNGLEVREQEERALENTLLRKEEIRRITRVLQGLKSQVTQEQRHKLRLEKEIQERVELRQHLLKQEEAEGSSERLLLLEHTESSHGGESNSRPHTNHSSVQRLIFPHYAVEESKQSYHSFSSSSTLPRSDSSFSMAHPIRRPEDGPRLDLSHSPSPSSHAFASRSQSQQVFVSPPSSFHGGGAHQLHEHGSFSARQSRQELRSSASTMLGAMPSASASSTSFHQTAPLLSSSASTASTGMASTTDQPRPSTTTVVPLPPVVGEPQLTSPRSRQFAAAVSTGAQTARPATSAAAMHPQRDDPMLRLHMQLAGLIEGPELAQSFRSVNKRANTVAKKKQPQGRRARTAHQQPASLYGGM